MASQRQLRVGELLRAAISEVLMRRDVRDPILQTTIITVSEVRASPDLRNANVFVAPLGDVDPKAVIEALNRAKKYLKGEIARIVNMKFMPELTFTADTTYDYAQSVDAMLASPKVARDLKRDEMSDEDQD
ncbi:MAG: 30S ribosome-binding factor RbfA [Parvibaculum sp.]